MRFIRILRGDTIRGPFSFDEFTKLCKDGKIQQNDLASINNGPWQPAFNSFHAPAPENPFPPGTPEENQTINDFETQQAEINEKLIETIKTTNWNIWFIWLFRIAMGASFIGIASPWYSVSSEISTPMFGGGHNYFAVTGFSTFSGTICSLLVAGSITMSFLFPLWKILFGIAASSLGLTAITAWHLAFATPYGANISTTFGGGVASARSGSAWGIWVCLFGMAISTLASYYLGFHASRNTIARLMDTIARKTRSFALVALILLGATVVLFIAAANKTGDLLVLYIAVTNKTGNSEGTGSTFSMASFFPQSLNANSTAFESASPLWESTHTFSTKACLYLFRVDELENENFLAGHLFFQQFNSPITGRPENDNPAPQERTDSKRALAVSKGTGFRSIKMAIQATNMDVYQVHYGTITTGKHKGKEGWVAERCLRPSG